MSTRLSQPSDTFSWEGESYDVNFKPKTGKIEAKLYAKQPKKFLVACLEGSLLERPKSNFQNAARRQSDECFGIVRAFCNEFGDLKFEHPLLDEDTKHKGGFLHIEKVEVKPSHAGKLLGLRFLHHILEQCRWSICAIKPLGLEILQWDENSKLAGDLFSFHPETKEDFERLDGVCIKVQRHFARMGFVQAGTTKNSLCTVWFLTNKAYFRDEEPSNAIDRWLTKDESHKFTFAVPKRRCAPDGLDKELLDAVMELYEKHRLFDEFRKLQPAIEPQQRDLLEVTDQSRAQVQASIRELEEKCSQRGIGVNLSRQIEQIDHLFGRITTLFPTVQEQQDKHSKAIQVTVEKVERLVNQGANIYESRALFESLAHAEPTKLLLRLGAEVNEYDQDGNTPLHIVASRGDARMVETLLDAGADPQIHNDYDETPLMLAEFKADEEEKMPSWLRDAFHARGPGLSQGKRCVQLLAKAEEAVKALKRATVEAGDASGKATKRKRRS